MTRGEMGWRNATEACIIEDRENTVHGLAGM